MHCLRPLGFSKPVYKVIADQFWHYLKDCEFGSKPEQFSWDKRMGAQKFSIFEDD